MGIVAIPAGEMQLARMIRASSDFAMRDRHIRRLGEAGISPRDLARLYDLSQGRVRSIMRAEKGEK